MFYDARTNDHGLQLDPFLAIMVPRPIGWISTLSPEGRANLAPYSFFNAFAHDPHYIAFGSGRSRSGGGKDTLRNIEATGEFVHSMATRGLRSSMNATSVHAPHGADEFEIANIAKAECRFVAPPRVASSPVAFECKLHQIVPLPGEDGGAGDHLVIGRVVGIHIADEFIAEGRVDTAAMEPLARLGYSEYATINSTWRMRRPD
jgi:flavin reductase (DIM6/NTAB) family NADH-FMN oxidoreductase RutF